MTRVISFGFWGWDDPSIAFTDHFRDKPYRKDANFNLLLIHHLCIFAAHYKAITESRLLSRRVWAKTAEVYESAEKYVC